MVKVGKGRDFGRIIRETGYGVGPLPRQQLPELGAVVLARAVKHDRLCRHVHAHGKGLRGEQDLDEAAGEEHFHDFLHDREQPAMVYAHAAREHGAHEKDLW